MTDGPSPRREDLLRSRAIEPFDGALSDEAAVGVDGVDGGSPAVAARAFDGSPLDSQLVSGEGAGSFLDGPGDDPGDVELADRATGGDQDGSRVLDTERIHPIDDVGSQQAGAVVDLGSGGGAPRQDEGERNDVAGPHSAGESIELRSPRRLRWLLVAGGVLVAAVMAFAIFEPIQVLPRVRLAPGFAMVDQGDSLWTSDGARGSVTLYTFVYGDCGAECDSVHATMAEIARRAPSEVDLGDVDLNLVTVSFDPVRDVDRLQALADETGADGVRWRWAAVDVEDVDAVLGAGFRVYSEPRGDGSFAFDPAFVLVDGWGVIRGEYRYATVASDADKLVRHIGILGEELRNSHGAGSIAYEAAHVFLCYP